MPAIIRENKDYAQSIDLYSKYCIVLVNKFHPAYPHFGENRDLPPPFSAQWFAVFLAGSLYHLYNFDLVQEEIDLPHQKFRHFSVQIWICMRCFFVHCSRTNHTPNPRLKKFEAVRTPTVETWLINLLPTYQTLEPDKPCACRVLSFKNICY